jgi:hypothetical protein
LEAKYRNATSGARVLPDFIVIGAQRSGTSTLYQYLTHHPCIGSASRKEVSFFDVNYQRGLDWYRARFPTERRKRSIIKQRGVFLTGEASPNYMIYPAVPARVHAALPTVKLIAILRNPVDRAYSGYNRDVRKRREKRPFREAVDAEIPRVLEQSKKVANNPNCFSDGSFYGSFLGRGFYAGQLELWMKFFPRDHLLVLKGEAFFKNPRLVLNRACEFLGIPPWTEESFRETATKPVQAWVDRKYSYEYPRLDTTVRERLAEFYRPHNGRLYDLVGEDFGWDR